MAGPSPPANDPLPPRFRRWFAARGWTPRAHQLELLETARDGRSALLIAPTGAGKTLAGFLPSLVELAEARMRRLMGHATRAPHPDPLPTGERGKHDASSLPPDPLPAGERGRVARGGTPEADLSPSPRARGEGRGEGQRSAGGIHTLYISPLKALAVDIARNLEAPIAEMALPVRVETRTGDTPAARRQRQRRDPPDILLTTPEQIALLLASADAPALFSEVRRVVVDELHALAPTKRGDLLALGIARLRRIAPGLTVVGLSATVRDPAELAAWLGAPGEPATIVAADRAIAAPPLIRMLETAAPLPWAGHTARHALPEIYATIKRHRLSLLFVNTRMQAELLFRMLWDINDDNLRIALHHGSLDVAQRRRVEAAMTAGGLDAVVCTSTLDLGIDWGDVDLVVNVGAPKGASRLLQRIGRANHRLEEASEAILAPSNRFEVLECRAAIDAAEAGAQDAEVTRTGALDVLAQHVLGMAVAEAFDADALFAEIVSAAPFAGLDRADFDSVLDFVATGGYALKSYERFARIRRRKDGLWRVSNPRIAQSYRMNIGTIVESTMLKVRLGRARSQGEGHTGPIRAGGRVLGEVEEYFAEQLSPGDTFAFGGEVVAFQAIVGDEAVVARAAAADPKVPSYVGARFPLSTHLAGRVRAMLAHPEAWSRLPDDVRQWLDVQREVSLLPGRDNLLVETFERAGRHYLVAYPFEGRLAHQTLGMLLTRRLERAGLRPLGFAGTDYAFCVWGAGDIQLRAARQPGFLDDLFSEDMLGDDLEEWLAESSIMKRTFRNAAIIAGMIERRYPGMEKRSRQVTMSSDLIYDVLRRHQPDHILLKAARADAATGLLDIRRLAEMLLRVRGRIVHKPLRRVSPLAIPVILEIGRESVAGDAAEALLEEAADDMIAEAMGAAGHGGTSG